MPRRLRDDAGVELERLAQRQRTIVEINRAVNAHLDRAKLFRAIARSLRPIVPFDRMGIGIAIANEKSSALYVVEDRNDETDWVPGATRRYEGTLPGWVLTNRRPFIASDLRDLTRFPVSEQDLSSAGMQCCCLLPLLIGDRAIGYLFFLSREVNSYMDEDLPFYAEMAEAVAVALNNCLAYEEISRLKDRLAAENVYLQEEIKGEHNFEEIVGDSSALRGALDRVEAVAPTNATVIILGETGTGKELIARAVHASSRRKDRPLIKVNSAALPAGLLESELFGHEKGAFTGALSRKRGRFELADGGTLFLDEVGEIPLEAQVKLPRVLQEGEFEPVGSTETIRVDVRVITATNRDLLSAVDEGSFRGDLYYRLQVFPIEVPPLRDRLDDIPRLARYLADRAAAKMGKQVTGISDRSLARLESYSWPGNIRELENVVERALIVSRSPTLEIEDEVLRMGNLADSTRAADTDRTLAEVERSHIEEILRETGGVIGGPAGAGMILGLNPSTLRSRIRRLGVRPPGGAGWHRTGSSAESPPGSSPCWRKDSRCRDLRVGPSTGSEPGWRKGWRWPSSRTSEHKDWPGQSSHRPSDSQQGRPRSRARRGARSRSHGALVLV